MVTVKDIAWMAGLLEGEGCFHLLNKKYPAISLMMTDYDVLLRAKKTWRHNKIYGPIVRKTKNGTYQKPIWQLRITGPKAIGWMMTVYSFLGTRRKEAIENCLSTWQSNTYRKYHRKWVLK